MNTPDSTLADARLLADLLVDDAKVRQAAVRLGGRLASLHQFSRCPTALLYLPEHRRLAWRAAMAVAELLEAAAAQAPQEGER